MSRVRAKCRSLIFLKFGVFVLFVCFCVYGFMLKYQVKDEENDKKPNILLLSDDGISREARHFMKQLNLVNPGENGKPVEFLMNYSDDIRSEIQYGYDGSYNGFISNMVSLNRELPDVRSDECKNKIYTNLPKCSILIPFHNEDWMLLLRTIHSIMNRSPPELIEEIMLVDDASDRENLKQLLGEYIKKYPKIKIVRSPIRQGITVTRMLGHVNCKGPIIVSVDSHVEVFPGWLEPILDRFTKDPNVLVYPKLTTIDEHSLEVYTDNKDAGELGGFRWNLEFEYVDIKRYEGENPTPMWEPKKSPTIIGSVHAISKDFFEQLGMFDPDFDNWDGADIELSFKVWLCGGKIEYVPCSFVAHMFKNRDYDWQPKCSSGNFHLNTDRIAEVWLDEYRRYYYRSVGHTDERNFGNIRERLEIQNKLHCKPFKWYIDNVYPEVPIPDEIRDEAEVSVDTQN